MKPRVANGLFACVVLLCTYRAMAQSYSIDWHKIAGGGGTSTGGVYSVSGTIGQHDAGGPMTNGQYSVVGGFWGIIAAVQTPAAPLLMITLTSTNTIMVSWPSPSTGWNPQQNTNLFMTNWTTPAESIGDNGIIKFILVNQPAGNRFYRLIKP
jgi:hypothetical protein